MSSFKEQLEQARIRAEEERLENLRKAELQRQKEESERQKPKPKSEQELLADYKSAYRINVIHPVVLEVFEELKTRVSEGQEWTKRPVNEDFRFRYVYSYWNTDSDGSTRHTSAYDIRFNGILLTRGVAKPKVFSRNNVLQIFAGFVIQSYAFDSLNDRYLAEVCSISENRVGGRGPNTEVIYGLGSDLGIYGNSLSFRFKEEQEVAQISDPRSEKVIGSQDLLRSSFAREIVSLENKGIL